MKTKQDSTNSSVSGVFRLVFSIEYRGVNDAMCPEALWETCHDRLYSSRRSAVAKAQSLFDRQSLNGHVLSVHAVVYRMVSGVGGVLSCGGRVYNRYKTIPHDIYGYPVKD